MTSKASVLGLLALERGQEATAPSLAPLPNTILDKAVVDTPIIWEVVEGALVERVVKGEPFLEASYVAAARRLEERGATAIHSTCGFAYRYQRAVAAAVKVPVALSSLIILPSLLRQVPSHRKIAVLTYDSRCLGDDVLQVDEPIDRERIVIGGIQGGKFWHDERKVPPPPIDVDAIRREVTACVYQLRDEHPGIAAIVLECGAFPVVAPELRSITGLPVYDTTTLCQMILAAMK